MSKESRNLLLFFVFTLTATYIAYFSIVFAGWSPYEAPGLFLFLIGGSAPSWVGILFVLFSYDREQRRAYFRRLLPRLIPGRWWAIILLVFPLLIAIVYALELLLGGSLPGMELLKAYIAQPSLLPLAILLGLGSGPIPEEFGWRGYALDPLIRRFGRIPGSVLLGLIWGVWHLGLFFMPQTWHGQLGFRFAGFATFMLGSVGLTLLMTWVHVNTHGSILAAILMHLMNNQTNTVLAPHADRVEILRTVVLIVIGLAVCLWMERKSRQSPALSADQATGLL